MCCPEITEYNLTNICANPCQESKDIDQSNMIENPDFLIERNTMYAEQGVLIGSSKGLENNGEQITETTGLSHDKSTNEYLASISEEEYGNDPSLFLSF